MNSQSRLLESDLEALRDAAFEALAPAAREAESTLAAPQAGDDAGTLHHFRRLVIGVKATAASLGELARLSEKAPET